ncbi:MAG: VCBS repeat-containing protein, partial [Candidatus Aminicenantes bacterium]|nr:VCBS repeat-containing protein [Candidatus Aminicenantes bacterium]
MRFGPSLLVLFLVATGDGPANAEAQGSAPRFADQAREAGIDFRHHNGARGGFHLLEIMGSGASLLDFDGDGYLDLFIVAGSSIPPRNHEESRSRLYRNRGDGTFRDVTQSSGLLIRTYGMGAAAGDYDNDGDPDLYVTGYPRSYLFRNQGNGRFRDVSREAGVENAGHWGSSAGFFDYDRDGLLDLFVCNYVGYDPGRETPCHTAGRRNYCHPTTFETDASVLYRNLGNGTFQDRSESSGIGDAQGKALGVAFTDLEPDGYPDVFVANDTEPDFLFRNNRDGTFQEVGFDQGVALDENGHPGAGMG